MISRRIWLPVVAAAALLAGCSDSGVPVTYEVFGTGQADVTYYNGSEDVSERVTLPWRKDLHIDKKKFTLKVQAGKAEGGEVTACAASVNDERVVQATVMSSFAPLVLCEKEYSAG